MSRSALVLLVLLAGCVHRGAGGQRSPEDALHQLETAEAAAHLAGTRVRLALRPDPVLIARDETAPGEPGSGSA